MANEISDDEIEERMRLFEMHTRLNGLIDKKTFAHRLIARIRAQSAEIAALREMTKRAVKYADEDRMVTPGSTRLRRVLDELQRFNDAAAPVLLPCPLCGQRVRTKNSHGFSDAAHDCGPREKDHDDARK